MSAGFADERFRPVEKLKSAHAISQLFSEGNSINYPPLRILWKEVDFDSLAPVKVAISVPKRLFNLASSRNKIKRILREAYRKNKNDLYNLLLSKEISIHLIVIYTSAEPPVFADFQNKLISAFERLMKQYENTGSAS